MPPGYHKGLLLDAQSRCSIPLADEANPLLELSLRTFFQIFLLMDFNRGNRLAGDKNTSCCQDDIINSSLIHGMENCIRNRHDNINTNTCGMCSSSIPLSSNSSAAGRQKRW